MTYDNEPDYNNEQDQSISIEQYKVYMDLLRQTSLQRAISNYFFIAINVAILLGSWIFLSFRETTLEYGNLSYAYNSLSENLYLLAFMNLAVVGIVLSLYWYQENRESYIINEFRYRTLIEIETHLFKRGIFNKEWDRLGDYKFRRTPVLFVSLGRTLPLIFALLQAFNLFIWLVRFRAF